MSKILLQLILGLATLSSAAALNSFLSDPVYLNYRVVERQLFRWEFGRLDDASQNSVRILFSAHQRVFHLILRPITRNASPFSEDLSVIEDGVHYKVKPENFIYEAPSKSLVYGSLFDGIFDGQIFLSDGNSFTVEKSTKYFAPDELHDGYHSVIYHDNKEYMNNDMRPNAKFTSAIEEESMSDDQKENRNIHDRDSKGRYHSRKCSIHLQIDHKLYQEILRKEGFRDPTRTREELIALLYMNIRAANDIFRPTNFNGIRGVNFEVKRITINSGVDCSQDKCKVYTAPDDYLNDFIVLDHSEFCLAYLMTFRDFGGVTGAAVRALPGYRRGACAPLTWTDKFRKHSANIGFVTLSYNGYRLPPRMTQATLAHELGHSLGAGHDGMGEEANPEGNFLMRTASYVNYGDKPNNYKFSRHSIAQISAVLDEMLKKEPVNLAEILGQPPREHRGPKRNCLQSKCNTDCIKLG